MKNVLVSLFCAAVLMAPAMAGGDCCSKQTSQATPAATCAKDGKTAKADCCAKEAKAEQTAEKKASCCSDKQQAKAPEKACQTCSNASWMMDKPNADCKACQSASL